MQEKEKPSCKHCGVARRIKSRGLCRWCHDDLGIREKYKIRQGGYRKDPTKKRPCENCKKLCVPHGRGLCHSCSTKPEIREKFPITSKYARRGSGVGVRRRDAGLQNFPPTSALAGSEEKIRVMAERALAGLPLFHPHDEIRKISQKEEASAEEQK